MAVTKFRKVIFFSRQTAMIYIFSWDTFYSKEEKSIHTSTHLLLTY